MSKSTSVGTVRIKKNCTPLLKENLDRISVLFSASLLENDVECTAGRNKDDSFVVFDVCTGPLSADRTHSPDFILRLQILCRLNIMFGTPSIFGTSSNQNPFAQNPPAAQTNNPFGPSTSNANFQNPSPFASTPNKFPSFGGAANNQTFNFGQSPFFTANNKFEGTVVKYSPVQETETALKNGISSLNHVRLCSITCMSEYLDKSFEELRHEDYIAKRKGVFCINLRSSNNNNNNQLVPKSTNLYKPGFSFTPNTAMNTFSGQGSNNNNNPSSFLSSNNAIFSNNTTGSSPLGFSSLLQKPPVQESKPFQFSSFGSSNSPFGNQTPMNQTPFGGQVNSPFGGINTQQPTPSVSSPFGVQPNTQFGSSTPSPNAFGVQSNNATFGVNAQTSNSPFGVQPVNPQTSGTSNFGIGTRPANSLFGTQAAPFGAQFAAFNPQPAVESINAPALNTQFGLQSNANNQQPSATLNFANQSQFNASQACSTGLNKSLFTGNIYESPQKTFSFNSPSLNVTSYGMQTSTPSFELKSPPGIEALRDMLNQSNPYGYSPIYKDLRAPDASTIIRANTEILARIEREVVPPPKQTVKEMHTLFNSLDAGDDGGNDFLVRRSVRQLRIKPVVPPLMPLVLDSILEKKDHECPKEVVEEPPLDPSFEYSPDSSNSPAILAEKDSSDEEVDTVIPHCGVIQTRCDYYTLPALEDLPNFENADGACLVKGFTVGRRGFGNVHFFDTIDVSNLDLDKIVDIGFREITVYPDDGEKPPLGEGLNRRAQVTLDGVYPRREDGDFETSVDKLKERGYEDTLRIVCVRMEVDFVEYRPESGSWVFIVPHFSSYSIDRHYMSV